MTPNEIQPPAEQTATNPFPDRVLVKDIDRKSEEWTRYHYAWELMNWLYCGGVDLEIQCEQFLKRRPKELSDVYQSRVENFKYQNHVGTAIDWYLAALFEKPARIEPEVEAGTTVEPWDTLNQDQKDYYDGLEKNCDRAGTEMVEHFRTYFKHLLLYGRACSLIDLPVKGEYNNALEEREAGQFDPYVVTYDPRQLINCGKDQHGALDWIVFSARETHSDGPLTKTTVVDRWYYFDKTNFAVYEREVPPDEKGKAPDDAVAKLVAGPEPHALAKENKVPVIFTEVPEGLWLMNRAFSLAKDHLNTDNVLGWSLMMAALAMPVIKMDGEYTLTLSEAGFIKLPKDADYSWSEPEGKSFAHLATRLDSLKEELFRSFYLIAQARNTGATPAAQSGVSKQQDMTAPKKILNLFGDKIRQVIETVYNGLAEAREEDTSWDVRGFEFPEDPPDATLDMIATIQTLDIPSDTFEKEMDKLAVDSTLPDANQTLREKIHSEIDAAPNRQDRELAMQQQQAQTMVTSKLNKTDFKGL